MGMLLKAQVSTETANAVLKDGSLGDTLNSILADTKPEAVYFLNRRWSTYNASCF